MLCPPVILLMLSVFNGADPNISGFFRKQLQSLLGSHICSSVLDLHIGCCPSVRGNFNSLHCIYLIFLKQETLNEEQDYIPDMFPPQAKFNWYYCSYRSQTSKPQSCSYEFAMMICSALQPFFQICFSKLPC